MAAAAARRRLERVEQPQHVAPCHWRTAAETLDVIEALERMESVLLQMAARVQRIEERTTRVPLLGVRLADEGAVESPAGGG